MAAVLPAPSVSSVMLAGAFVKVGGVVSLIVNVAVVVAALLHASRAVKVTVAAPVAPHRSDSVVKL